MVRAHSDIGERFWRWFALGAVAALTARADLRVAGSDLLGVEFTRELLAFGAANSQPITLALDGSRSALDDLTAARADLALVVLPTDDAPPAADFANAPFCHHVASVVVPRGCPLSEITLPQLARVFGARVTPATIAWGELGISAAPWVSAPVIPVAPKRGTEVMLEFFRHLVLSDGEFKPATRRYAATDELPALLAGELKWMALVSSVRSLPAGFKLLAVAREARRVAFLPTEENVFGGDYPLQLPVRVMFRRGRGAELAPVLRFLFGDVAARALEHANLATAALHRRTETLRRLETL